MSPEESDENNSAAAVAAPVSETKESPDQVPIATAAPVASAAPAANESNEIKEEPAKSDEQKEQNTAAAPAEKPTAATTPVPSTAQSPTTPNTQPTSYSTSDYDYSYAQPPAQQQSFFGLSTEGLPYPFFLHNNFLMLFIFIGMLFTLIGGIMSGSAIISANSDVYGASVIAISIGLFTISTFIILAALFREDLDHFIRLGFLIVGSFAIFGMILISRFGFAII